VHLPVSDERILQIGQWLTESCGLRDWQLQPASADASFRRYFRLQQAGGGSLIVMDAPADKEDCRPYLKVAAMLQQVGVHVPHVHAQDLQGGFILLEDLGERLYLGELAADSVERLYGDALAALATMQACVDASALPAYDGAMLQREMALFPDWLLSRHLQLQLSDEERQQLEQTFAALEAAALEQPRVFVHRDYHSRNLLVSAPPSPGVIDFQDAVHGPITYDLVSLLRDCYIAWPLDRVDDWAMGYYWLAVQSGILPAHHESDFLRWLDLMGAQRHLKAAGIFARLWHRDGKSGYLGDIPRTLGYICQVADRRPELGWLAGFIEARVLPDLPARALTRGD